MVSKQPVALPSSPRDNRSLGILTIMMILKVPAAVPGLFLFCNVKTLDGRLQI